MIIHGTLSAPPCFFVADLFGGARRWSVYAAKLSITHRLPCAVQSITGASLIVRGVNAEAKDALVHGACHAVITVEAIEAVCAGVARFTTELVRAGILLCTYAGAIDTLLGSVAVQTVVALTIAHAFAAEIVVFVTSVGLARAVTVIALSCDAVLHAIAVYSVVALGVGPASGAHVPHLVTDLRKAGEDSGPAPPGGASLNPVAVQTVVAVTIRLTTPTALFVLVTLAG
jgi:hypothetical protein